MNSCCVRTKKYGIPLKYCSYCGKALCEKHQEIDPESRGQYVICLKCLLTLESVLMKGEEKWVEVELDSP